MRASITSNARRLLDTDLGRHGYRRVLSATAAHSVLSLQAHGRNISSSRLLQRQAETHGPSQPHIPKIPKIPHEKDVQPDPPASPSMVVSGGGQFTTGSSAFDALLTTVCGVGMRECSIFDFVCIQPSAACDHFTILRDFRLQLDSFSDIVVIYCNAEFWNIIHDYCDIIAEADGTIAVFFGGVAYVSWYKANVLDKVA